MSDVKPYSPFIDRRYESEREGIGPDASMEESLSGLFVAYSDYAALEQENQRLRDELEADRGDFINLNEYWNGGIGGAGDACEHTCEVTEKALKRLQSRLDRALQPEEKA